VTKPHGGWGGGPSTSHPSTLSGNTDQGDTVSVKLPSNSNTYTLVVYSAPTSYFSDSNAYQQSIVSIATGTYSSTGSSHTLTVTIPNNNYQIDFICGQAIDELEPNQNDNAYGPDSSEMLYHAQQRFIDGDNGGNTAPTNLPTPRTPQTPKPSSSPSTTQSLSDSATLSGGYKPTGTIVFYLMAPGSTASTPLGQVVFTDTVTVTGNGTYTTAGGTTTGSAVPTMAGTYQWVVIYNSGDANNGGITGPFGSEPEVVNYPLSIAGTVYCDMNVNDTLSSGDQGLSGVTV
jgi:hypothetical protein